MLRFKELRLSGGFPSLKACGLGLELHLQNPCRVGLKWACDWIIVFTYVLISVIGGLTSSVCNVCCSPRSLWSAPGINKVSLLCCVSSENHSSPDSLEIVVCSQKWSFTPALIGCNQPLQIAGVLFLCSFLFSIILPHEFQLPLLFWLDFCSLT